MRGNWRAKYRDIDGVRHKQCPRCKAWKPHGLSHFQAKKRYPDGHVSLQSWCAPCQRENVNRLHATPEKWARHVAEATQSTLRRRREKRAQMASLLQKPPAVALDVLTQGWGA